MAADAPRPARSARRDELLELTHEVRKALVRKGEFLPSGWEEEAAGDLVEGRFEGWLLPEAAGLAFYSVRPHRAYGHVHVGPGAEAVARAERLARTVIEHLPEAVARIDIGVSGLAPEEERALAGRLELLGGASTLSRLALELPGLPTAAGPAPLSPPAGLELVPVASVPTSALAELDWRGFRGTSDENLAADTLEEDRRGIEEIISGRLGRFLDEASTAVLEADGRLVAAMLVSEQSPQLATFLDLVVDPERRRRGIGRFLLRWGLRALAALGYSTARLWVTESNAPARRLYETLGFRPVATALIYRWARPGPGPQPHSER